MDHINLDDRETYRREQALLFKMPAGKLKKVVAGLYEIRYTDQEECVEVYYRLAVSVLLKRNKKSIGDIICFIEIISVILYCKEFY